MNKRMKFILLTLGIALLMGIVAVPVLGQAGWSDFWGDVRFRGNTWANGTLLVDGATTLTGATTFTGASTHTGAVDHVGNVSDSGGVFTIADNAIVDGAADVVQLTVQGYTTQTSAIDLFVVETSDGTDVFQVGTVGPLLSTSSISATGAITITAGLIRLTGSGATAYTVAAPTATTHDGLELQIYTTTAEAHTITFTTIGVNELDAAGDVCTLGGAAGDGITVVASGGEWYTTDTTDCTLG